MRTEIAQRKQKLLAARHNEAHNAIFKRAVAESDELEVRAGPTRGCGRQAAHGGNECVRGALRHR